MVPTGPFGSMRADGSGGGRRFRRAQPAALGAPAADSAVAGRLGDAEVAGGDASGDVLQAPAGSEELLGADADARPGVGARPRARRAAAEGGKMGIHGLVAICGHGAGGAPDARQGDDEITAAAAGEKGDRGMIGAKPDGDPVAEGDALSAAAGAIEADGAAGRLGGNGASLVEGVMGHEESVAGKGARVGGGVWRTPSNIRLALAQTAKWPPGRGRWKTCPCRATTPATTSHIVPGPPRASPRPPPVADDQRPGELTSFRASACGHGRAENGSASTNSLSVEQPDTENVATSLQHSHGTRTDGQVATRPWEVEDIPLLRKDPGTRNGIVPGPPRAARGLPQRAAHG